MATGSPDDIAQQAPATPYKLISAASTNGTLVVAGAHVLTGYFFSNQNAAVRYVKLYDKGTSPTVGTDIPKWTIAIPPGSSANIQFVHPLQFALGIGLGMTTGPTDADTGAVAANEVIANLAYI